MDAVLHSLTFLQAAAPEAVAAPTADFQWALLIVFLAVLILPWVLGTALANALKLPDLGLRMGVVLFSIFVALSPFAHQALSGRSMTKAIRLGIDLAGGTNLVFEVDQEKAAAVKGDDEAAAPGKGYRVDKATMEKLVAAVVKRINPSGAEEVTVRGVGRDRIEVIIPGVDQEVVEQKKRLITRLGSLEFAILANGKDHADLLAKGKALSDRQNDVRVNNRVAASWRDVAVGKSVGGGALTANRTIKRVVDNEERQVNQLLVVLEPPERAVTGRYLTSARPGLDQSGRLCVDFAFGAQGSGLFQSLTTRYQPDKVEGFQRQLAILLDGNIHSAPNLNEPISGRGQISGQFSKEEIDELVGVLNAGALEVPLKRDPVSEFTISPLLGADVQSKGITAIVVSTLAIVAFMAIYYVQAGIIANLCLLLNLILVVGSMAIISAAFTLPGLAGLVLTIGMAVDSNVLIYERMREELARGSSLRMAIHNGFDKAFSSIIDSNVTTLITAVILYLIGSDQIRGFAVSLFIGLTMSLFAVLYFGHLAFEVMERKRWAKSLTMLQAIKSINFDYLGKRNIAYVLSLLVIGGGLFALWTRGNENFDIDFTGGTMVTFEFKEPHLNNEVRAKLETTLGKTISLEQLTVPGQPQLRSGEPGARYRLRTTEQDRAAVRTKINEAFAEGGFTLTRVTMDISPLAAIEAPKGEDGQSTTISPAEERYLGGQKSALAMSDPISPVTIQEYMMEELRALGGGDGGKYTNPSALLAVEPANAAPDTGKHKELVVRFTSEVAKEDAEKLISTVQDRLAKEPVYEELNSFDSSVGNETRNDAIWATVLSLIVIVVYIWFRFEKVYFGYAAVAALVHDVLVTLGAVAVGAYLSRLPFGPLLGLEEFKINMTLMAALLTIVGYSLNDTIVIFDRIREIKGKSPNITAEMINASVNQTMSRTILTALTVFIVVVILYLFGGEGIHGFAYSLIIGSITGTYSTVFIANPVLLWLVNRDQTATPGKAKAA